MGSEAVVNLTEYKYIRSIEHFNGVDLQLDEVAQKDFRKAYIKAYMKFNTEMIEKRSK